jgi:hypothetical protein
LAGPEECARFHLQGWTGLVADSRLQWVRCDPVGWVPLESWYLWVSCWPCEAFVGLG